MFKEVGTETLWRTIQNGLRAVLKAHVRTEQQRKSVDPLRTRWEASPSGRVTLLHDKRPKREPPAPPKGVLRAILAPAFEPMGTGDDQPGGAAACGLGRPRKASVWSDLRHERSRVRHTKRRLCGSTSFFFFFFGFPDTYTVTLWRLNKKNSRRQGISQTNSGPRSRQHLLPMHAHQGVPTTLGFNMRRKVQSDTNTNNDMRESLSGVENYI